MSRLDDVQLRELLRLLLEAEATESHIPASAIRLGGNQNAADGGSDAFIQWDGPPEKTGWLPARTSHFQSKAESTPASKLRDELAPGGILRSIFAELADSQGAYVVFSTANCSEKMYRERVAAMQEAITSVPRHDRIIVDFYDSSRIARWVNQFNGVTNRVRDMLGCSLAGWRPFENWSAPSLPIAQEYLLDTTERVTRPNESADTTTVAVALAELRKFLNTPGTVARLIGVSGVGKTRLAQALFDARIGEQPLNPARVVYGDLSMSPAATPAEVAERLVSNNRSAILIVDNCPGETHRAIASIIQRGGSGVSLLTIDFDIGTDDPENTRVFQLHRNSGDLIGALLRIRAPNLSSLDGHRVVDFADGNARVALTIARQHGSGGGLANLSDRQLLDRLFLNKRRPTDSSLRRCAEVASLVYAFHVEAEPDQAPEHPILAELAGVTPDAMYEAIAEFVERGTAQKRGTQRSILPQALAIKLASQALERIPTTRVLALLTGEDRTRLFRSFTRQLGHLHDSERARKIASDLLSPNGRLHDVAVLSVTDVVLFENLAPAAQDAALVAIEDALNGQHCARFLSVENPQRWRFITLARHLAYEARLFDRAAHILQEFSKHEPADNKHNSAREQFFELFRIALSWTQAPPEQRFRYIDNMLQHGDSIDRRLAIDALDYALSTGHFSSIHDGSFGSRTRGREWRPATHDDQVEWFRNALSRLTRIARETGELADTARTAIATEIRGLIGLGLIDELVGTAKVIRAADVWTHGWKQLRQALHYDRSSWPPDTIAKAVELETQLRPVTLEERFVSYVTNDPWGLYMPSAEDDAGGKNYMRHQAEAVGEEAAGTGDLFGQLIERAAAFNNHSNCHAFGRGVANAAVDLIAAWDRLVRLFGGVTQNRNAAVLGGFLDAAAARIPAQVQDWLDATVEDPLLGPHIVELSLNFPIDARSVDRLTRTVHEQKVPVGAYQWLTIGGVTKNAPPEALAGFLEALSARPGGPIVAADILQMYLYAIEHAEEIAAAILQCGRNLLRRRELYGDLPRNGTHALASIARKCFAGEGHEADVRSVCKQLASGDNRYSLAHGARDLVGTLTQLHPKTVIDVVFQDDKLAAVLGKAVFGFVDDSVEQPQSAKNQSMEAEIVEWVMQDPQVRAIRIARYVPYHRVGADGSLCWTDTAMSLINLPNVGVAAARIFRNRFGVGVSRGPWSDRFVMRRDLIVALTSHPTEQIHSWASQELVHFDAEIARIREYEHVRDERFE